MYIKRLEIYGFKSFPYKTILNFSKGITAIVGPNGAGKSNILDAIKWVLGEQSTKRLRVKDLSELIYSGNSDKKIDFAEVKLVFAHDPPILEKYRNFEEIVIIRRYYRDGESEFYINNKPCRLKDIHFLFLDMGINPQSYGIIDQGEIYKFLEISPKERKKFIEDLAGISKLKLVQEETEKNLSYTETNLLRLNDIIKEVEFQYLHLKEQSERAKKYLNLKENLKKLLILKNEYLLKHSIKLKEDYLLKLNNLKIELNKIKEKIKEIEEEENKEYKILIEKEKRLKNLKREYENYKESLIKMEEKLKKIYKLESELISKKDKEEVKDKINKKRKEEILSELSKINDTLQSINLKVKEIEEEINFLKRKKKEKDEFFREKAEKLNYLNNELQKMNYEYLKIKENLKNLTEKKLFYEKEFFSINENLNNVQLMLENLENKKASLKKEEEEIKIQLKDIEKKIDFIEKEITNISKDLKILNNIKGEKLRELSAIEASLKLIGELTLKEEKNVLISFSNKILGESLNLSQEEIFILESFYGDLLKAILVNDLKDIENIINKYPEENLQFFLRDRLDNLNTEILFENLSPNAIYGNKNFFVYDKDKKLLFTPFGFILYLAQKKKGYFTLKKEYENQEKRKIEIINQINKLKEKELKLSEKKEQLIKQKDLLLNEIKNLNKTLNNIQEELKKIDLDYAKFVERKEFLSLKLNEINQNNKKTLLLIEESTKELEKIESLLNVLMNQKKEVEEEYKKIESQIHHLNEQIINKEKDLVKLKTDLNNLILRKNNLQKELENIEKAIKNTKSSVEQLKSEISALKKEITDLKKNKEEIMLKLKSFEDLKSQLEEEISTKSTHLRELNKLKRDFENQYKQLEIGIHNYEIKIVELNLTIEKLKEERKELQDSNTRDLIYSDSIELNMEEIDKEIETLKRELKNYDDVNLASIKEFELVAERYHNLLDQKRDLEKTVYDLKELLKELKEKAKNQLNDTLNKVNQKLKDIFPLIMEKGNAELFFTDADPLTAGLDLKIILPHKRIQHLHILSGGEKALCVIALLIAFYLTKPGPFCILDEVDAPLDEKNSLKFINLLKKIKENSQIILITHNPNVMKEVDSIFGVTMEEKGVSKVVKIELNNYFK